MNLKVEYCNWAFQRFGAFPLDGMDLNLQEIFMIFAFLIWPKIIQKVSVLCTARNTG